MKKYTVDGKRIKSNIAYDPGWGPRYAHSEITAIACTWCGAQPGEFCVKNTGKFSPWPHRARLYALPEAFPGKDAAIFAMLRGKMPS